MMNARGIVNTYPLSNYSYGTNKEAKPFKNASLTHHIDRFRNLYMTEGMRTSVEGILLVHDHNHPHVLVCKLATTFYKLPGGKLKSGENAIEGLKRKLSSKLSPAQPEHQQDWQIGECVGIWWRPNFENVWYPYIPPHITRPKECKKLYLVHLSERDDFELPLNQRLVAVPFMELYDNSSKYGRVLSYIPEQLSNFEIRRLSP